MSDDRIEKLEKSVKGLRTQVNGLSRELYDSRAVLRYTALACTLAGAMLALTATPWLTAADGDGNIEVSASLWGMVPDGLPAVLALVAVLLLALGTFSAFLADNPARWAHLTFVVVGLLGAVAILFAGADQAAPTVISYYDPDDFESGAGRWLTLLAALILAAVHGTRAAELRTR